MIYVNTILFSVIELLICGILCYSSCVFSAESVNCFKNWLDNFWTDQEIIYNFRAEIYEIRNRGDVSLIALANSIRICMLRTGIETIVWTRISWTSTSMSYFLSSHGFFQAQNIPPAIALPSTLSTPCFTVHSWNPHFVNPGSVPG